MIKLRLTLVIQMRYRLRYLITWGRLKKKRLLNYLFASQKKEYTKFAIVCTSRTGSTWLHTLLNAHPEIVSKGEIVQEKFKQGKIFDWDKHVFHGYHRTIKAVGLKVFYGLNHNTFDLAMETLQDDREIKVIHLIRQDKLSQFASLTLARSTNVWSHRSGKYSEPIHLDPSDFKRYKKDQSAFEEKINRDFEGRILTITYEELLSNQNEVLQQVQRFLGVTEKRLFSVLKKQSSVSLTDRIENRTDFE